MYYNLHNLADLPSDNGILDQLGKAKLVVNKGMVAHIESPALTGYHFEWHPEVMKVYAIRKGTVPLIGEVIAEKVTDQTTFSRVVEIWIKGYREGHTRLLGETSSG